MINVNYEVIINFVYENDSSLKEIIRGFNLTNIDAKLTTARFVNDLFKSSKQLQTAEKERFFSQLIKEELLSLLIEIMSYNEHFIVHEETKRDAARGVVEPVVRLTMKGRVEEKKMEEVKYLEMSGDQEIDREYNVHKLDLLKVHVTEILTNSVQILPSNVTLYTSFLRACKSHPYIGNPETKRLYDTYSDGCTLPAFSLRRHETRNLPIPKRSVGSRKRGPLGWIL